MHKRMCINNTYIPPNISMYIFLTFIFKSPLKKNLKCVQMHVTMLLVVKEH